MLSRRRLILATAALGMGVPSHAARVFRIGLLGAESASEMARRSSSVKAGLLDLGYVEGRNLSIESRWAFRFRNRSEQ